MSGRRRGAGRSDRNRVTRAPDSVVKPPVHATHHRTIEVLRPIASAPRSSNRQIAEIAGLVGDGRTSKLLGRLQRHGVIENLGLGAAHGESNARLLTPYGQQTCPSSATLLTAGRAPSALDVRGLM